MKLSLLLALLLLISDVLHAQSQREVGIVSLGTGKAYRFKGLTMSGSTAYLGSWDKKEIVAVSLTDKKSRVLKTKYSGRLNAMGCYIADGVLFVVMNEVINNPKRDLLSAMVMIDLKTEEVIRSYEAKGKGGRHHFNHIVVGRNGVAYVSNTLKSAIYTVDTRNATDSLKLLVRDNDLAYVHGIDLSPDGKTLYTTSYEAGIRILNLQTLQFGAYRDKATAGDDGLRFHNGNLYGVGQNSIKRYTMDAGLTKITKIDTLLADHPVFNDPRCLHVEGNILYCLANIEFDAVPFQRPRRRMGRSQTDTHLVSLRLGE